MPAVDERWVVREALDYCVRGAEDRLGNGDHQMAAVFVEIGRSYLNHPAALGLTDDLPWRRLLRRLGHAHELAGPPSAEAGTVDFIEHRIGLYLREARRRLTEAPDPWMAATRPRRKELTT